MPYLASLGTMKKMTPYCTTTSPFYKLWAMSMMLGQYLKLLWKTVMKMMSTLNMECSWLKIIKDKWSWETIIKNNQKCRMIKMISTRRIPSRRILWIHQGSKRQDMMKKKTNSIKWKLMMILNLQLPKLLYQIKKMV